MKNKLDVRNMRFAFITQLGYWFKLLIYDGNIPLLLKRDHVMIVRLKFNDTYVYIEFEKIRHVPHFYKKII